MRWLFHISHTFIVNAIFDFVGRVAWLMIILSTLTYSSSISGNILSHLQPCNMFVISGLSCDVWLDSDFWGEISMFSYHLDLVQKIQVCMDLVWKIKADGHITVLYQWQCHLSIVMSHNCLDNNTYSLFDHNGCLLWRHEAVIWNISLSVMSP